MSRRPPDSKHEEFLRAFASFTNAQKAAIALAIAEDTHGFTQEELDYLRFEWRFWARPNQLAPDGDWDGKTILLCLAGRGFGKTRALVEWIRERVAGGAREIVLAGQTSASIRDVIVEGESGILRNSPNWDRPHYEPSKCRLTWKNGARAFLLSAEEPDSFRGKQADTAACDELAAWANANAEDVNSENQAFNQLRFGCRLRTSTGGSPKIFIATTPRPVAIIRSLVTDPDVVLRTGSTKDNEKNLAPSFIRGIYKQYGDTRLGQQEIEGKLLDEAKGAFWKAANLDKTRIKDPAQIEHIRRELVRIVVAIDPAVSAKKTSDETGIIVAGLGSNGHCYILQDLSGIYSPDAWARIAVNAYRINNADRVIAEKNNGGDLVEQNLRTVDGRIPFRAISASKGKASRAEPVSALSEQGLIHMVGHHQELEQQLVLWEPHSGQPSPDRLDAFVYAVTELMMTTPPYRSLPDNFRSA